MSTPQVFPLCFHARKSKLWVGPPRFRLRPITCPVHSPISIVIYSAMVLIIVLGIWLKHRQARFEAALSDIDTATIRTVDEEIAAQLRKQ